MPLDSSHLLKVDARNRSFRTFLVGLAFAVLTAVGLVLVPVFTSANSWDDIHWSLLGFSLVQAVVTSLFAYILRAKLDASGFPTPLPPTPQPEPADPEGGYVDVSLALLIGCFIGIVLLLFRVHFGG
jgi:hypothetical protein